MKQKVRARVFRTLLRSMEGQTPAWFSGFQIQILLDLTARGFGMEKRQVWNLSPEQALQEYAEFTVSCMNSAPRQGPAGFIQERLCGGIPHPADHRLYRRRGSGAACLFSLPQHRDHLVRADSRDDHGSCLLFRPVLYAGAVPGHVPGGRGHHSGNLRRRKAPLHTEDHGGLQLLQGLLFREG